MQEAGAHEAGTDAAVEPAACQPFDEIPSEPTAPIYQGWPELNVDILDLQAVLSSWSLVVGGLVESPLALTFADLMCLPRQDQVTDLHCGTGWSVQDIPWNGVALSTVLARAKPKASATHVAFRSFPGTFNEKFYPKWVKERPCPDPVCSITYDECIPLSICMEARSLLAYGVGGSTLPVAHGFPLRVVVPRLYGYKGAKRVCRIELVDQPIPGFWARQGYDPDGLIPADQLRPGKY